MQARKNLRNKIVNHLKSKGFGTKNLPDAIEWHCSAYWNHILSKKQVSRSKKTKEKLETAIAIPVWLKKSLNDYLQLGKSLRNI